MPTKMWLLIVLTGGLAGLVFLYQFLSRKARERANQVILYGTSRREMLSENMPYELCVEMNLMLSFLYRNLGTAIKWAQDHQTPDAPLVVVAFAVPKQMLKELTSSRDQDPLVEITREGRYKPTTEALQFLVPGTTIKPVWMDCDPAPVWAGYREMVAARDEHRAEGNRAKLSCSMGWDEYLAVVAKTERGEYLTPGEEQMLARIQED